MTTGTHVPKYYVLKQKLLAMIEDAAPGDAIPTERELAAQFDTSRTTVRQAITQLVAEGRLQRTQGSGTYVSEPKSITLRQLTSFSEDLAARGYDTSARILEVTRDTANRQVAAALGAEPGDPVTRVTRIRYVDDTPLAVETAHLPGRYPRLRAQLERHGSLYRTLREVYGIDITVVEDTVETAPADPHHAQLLGCEVGMPMLLVCREAWNADGAPVEVTRSVYRGDRFRFVARTEGT